MSLFKRISDSFWSYVSPQKPAAHLPTPNTAPPVFKKPVLPTKRGSFKTLKRTNKSMSPQTRVDSWRATTSTSPLGKKRALTPDRNGDGSRKMRKLDDGKARRAEEVEYEDDDDDTSVGDEVMRDDEGLSSMFSTVHVDGSPTPEDFLDDYDSEVDVHETEVLDDGDYHVSPNRRKLGTLPEEQTAFGVGSSELRAAGWDDDHITLVQKLEMRGHEPLMPHRWAFSFRSMPDALFAPTNDAFISSACSEHFRAEKALEKLIDLGGHVRDSLVEGTRTRPHREISQNMKLYQKWADWDSGLDTKATIPLLEVVVKAADTPPTELHKIANQKLGELAKRYRRAFRAVQSTEGSPASKASSQYSYPVPTLYALVVSHAIIAMMVYKSDDPAPDAVPIMFFDMKEIGYDVWNALALAIVVCHARNVQMRIAEDTGVGQKVAGRKRTSVSADPDA